MKVLVLRVDAPLLSFGSVIIDQHGFIDRFPGQSMLTGLIANALGWHHGDFERLESLQSRLHYAARWDVSPQRLVDYHTVDLGQPKMQKSGWTTWGKPEHRDGGSAKFDTHIRYRHHWADGLMTVVLALEGKDSPDLAATEKALRCPARPLFLGRKSCLPARPLLDPKTPRLEGQDVVEILDRVPLWNRAGQETESAATEACWPAELGASSGGAEIRCVYDLRDWSNQLPAGSRLRIEGQLQEKSS